MTALAAVMVFVSYATFDWHSIRPETLRRMPAGETVVMLATVAVTVATDNLALGVGVGVLVTMAVFSRRVAHLLDIERRVAENGESARYTIGGELFFASNEELTDAFHHPEDPAHIVIDVSAAHIWDASRSPPWTPSPTSTNVRANRSSSSASTSRAGTCTHA